LFVNIDRNLNIQVAIRMIERGFFINRALISMGRNTSQKLIAIKMTKTMSNKVVVISGGVTGIGLATAVKFAQGGYDISIVDINKDRGKEAERKIKEMGQDAIFCLCDISNKVQVNNAGQLTKDRFGRVDILVNNASLEIRGSILQCSEDDWERTFDINLKGIYNMSNAFIPMIIKEGSGSVINIGSILGYRAVNEYAVYASSKGAIDTLTKSMAFDLAKHKIRVNCVAPGAIDTPRLREWIDASPAPFETETLLDSKSVLNRMGKSEEVANVIYFLASNEASFVTGATYFVDGGWSI
jgi:NAD(P)-dependent dehydrogenase (short-subunit alcohol dehydrogenase family)